MKNLSIKARLWSYAAGCGLFTVLLWYFFFTGSWIEYSARNSELTTEREMKKSELLRIQTMTQRQGVLESQIRQAERDFSKLREMFPDQDSIPKRLQDLTMASRQASITPLGFRPDARVEKEFYVENHYQVEVSAGFHGLGAFFQEIANFPYPTAISQVSILQNKRLDRELQQSEETGQPPQTASGSFRLTTFSSE